MVFGSICESRKGRRGRRGRRPGCHTLQMNPIPDLEELLASLRPQVRGGEFVFVTLSPETAQNLEFEASVVEPEGVSVVLRREIADAAGLPYDFVAGWITLGVHSALDAVGLTAAVAGRLAWAGISCNVIAGFHHDHLLVPAAATADALRVLQELTAEA